MHVQKLHISKKKILMTSCRCYERVQQAAFLLPLVVAEDELRGNENLLSVVHVSGVELCAFTCECERGREGSSEMRAIRDI